MERINATDLQIAHSSEQTAMVMSSHGSAKKTLLNSIAALAEARQAPISEQGLRVYSTVLAKHRFSDVLSAIQQLISEPRPQYGPAFPEVGAIVKLTEEARQRRVSPPKFHACGSCFNGMVYLDAHGQPCDVSASPRRLMGACACKRQWLEERRQRALASEVV